jgi:hypothetical protein
MSFLRNFLIDNSMNFFSCYRIWKVKIFDMAFYFYLD